MKNLFGKVLVGAAGFVMALGMTAFAANEIKIETVTPNKDTGAVTISGTITADADAPESTIIVVEENVSLATLEDAQIKYIDQETAQSGAFSYDFVLETGKVYDVYCGGTDVASPGQNKIDLTAAAGSVNIVGKVTLSAEGAQVTKVTATAGAKTVNADATGAYKIEVAPGTYDVVVGRAGYLYKTFKGVQVAADKDTNLDEVNLLAGNVIDSESAAGVINLEDLQALLNTYRVAVDGEGFNANADLNDDDVINLADLQALLNNYRQSVSE